jgi:hypothetical protein
MKKITKFNYNFSSIIQERRKEYENKLVFGISKRFEKIDKFKYILFDFSIMDLNKEIIHQNTLKYKLLDFSNKPLLETEETKDYNFSINNKYIRNKLNRDMFSSKSQLIEKIKNLNNYEDNFEKEKIKEISIIKIYLIFNI